MSPADGMAFEATADIWDTNHTAHVIVDCLLPTGIIVQLNVRKDIALADLKDVCIIYYCLYKIVNIKICVYCCEYYEISCSSPYLFMEKSNNTITRL